MIRIIVSFGFMLFLACGFQHADRDQDAIITDSCTVDGIKLILLNKGNESLLSIHKNNKTSIEKIAITPPCFFLRRDNQIQAHFFSDVNTKVIIVAGELIDKEKKISLGADEDDICGRKAQGILLKSDSIIVTKRIMKGGMACKDYGLDHKDFYTFAYRR